MDAAQIVELTRLLGLPVCVRCEELVARRGKSVWRVDCAQESFAVRVFRPGDDESALHERQMMIFAREAGLPVGAVHGAATIDGCPVLIVDWRSGRDVAAKLRTQPWAAPELGKMFGEQQARLHDVASDSCVDHEWIDFFGDVDPATRERLETSAASASLIHLDYHPANILADSKGISAILDWTNSRFGDRRADLARTWSVLRIVFRPGRRHPLLRLAHDVFADAWWRSYTRVAGPQAQMPLFCAWAIDGLLRKKVQQKRCSKQTQLIGLARLSQKLRAEAQLPEVTVEELLRRT